MKRLDTLYAELDDEIVDLYEDIRCDDDDAAAQYLEQLLGWGMHTFHEQWKDCYGEDVAVDGAYTGRFAVYDEIKVDTDAALEDVAKIHGHAMQRQVYDSFLQLLGAAVQDDKDYLTAMGSGAAMILAAPVASAVNPELADQYALMLEWSWMPGTAVGGWGWWNLHRKYGPPQGWLGGVKQIFTKGDWPASKRGTHVIEHARDNLAVIDPPYKQLDDGELGEYIRENGDTFFDARPVSREEYEQDIRRLADKEDDTDCKFVKIIWDATADKQRIWTSIDQLFPDAGFDTLDDVFDDPDRAYTPGSGMHGNRPL